LKLAVLLNQVSPAGLGWVLAGHFEFIRAPSSRWKAWRCQACPAPRREPLAGLQESRRGADSASAGTGLEVKESVSLAGAEVLDRRRKRARASVKSRKADFGSLRSGRGVTAASSRLIYPVVS